MKSDDLNALINEAGIAPTWQAALGRLGFAIAKAVAPQVFALVERLAVSGATSLVTRLAQATAPAETPDYALSIVRGIERMHGPGAPLDQQWPGAQRAEYARDAIKQWLLDSGANPDDALLGQIVETAVGKLRVEQAAIGKAAAG